MYYGEEIGMRNNDPKRREDVKDPIGRLGWPKEKGRDGERTPMQWSTAPNAGFTKGKPWLPAPPTYRTHNVAAERADPNSILNFYRHVLALRRNNPAVREGKYVALNESDPNVLSYLRQYKDQAVLVVLNMSAAPQKVSFDLSGQGFSSAKLKPLVSTTAQPSSSVTEAQAELDGFGVLIAQVEK